MSKQTLHRWLPAILVILALPCFGAMPKVFDLEVGKPLAIQVGEGGLQTTLKLLAVREQFWPDRFIPNLPEGRTFRSAEVDLEVGQSKITLFARPFELPRLVAGLRLYVESTLMWGTSPQLDPLTNLTAAVRLSCVLEGESWGPETLRFPVRNYRLRANTYANTWAALVPYNKLYYHRGEDFGAIPDRLEVVASLGGVITHSPLPNGDGESNHLGIRTPEGFGLDYYHMNLESLISERTMGSEVAAGDLLGKTGMTWSGRKSQQADPHLHWGLHSDQGAVASYPFAIEAYLRDYPDSLVAVAGGYHYAVPGESVLLDGSRTVFRKERSLKRAWWILHDGSRVEGLQANMPATSAGCYSEELRVVADDGSEDRDYAQLRVWSSTNSASVATGWFYHFPLRGIHPGTPVLFWNRLSNTTSAVEIDFGDGTGRSPIEAEATHAYAKPGLYTTALRSRGPRGEPITVQMRVVVDTP